MRPLRESIKKKHYSKFPSITAKPNIVLGPLLSTSNNIKFKCGSSFKIVCAHHTFKLKKAWYISVWIRNIETITVRVKSIKNKQIWMVIIIRIMIIVMKAMITIEKIFNHKIPI